MQPCQPQNAHYHASNSDDKYSDEQLKCQFGPSVLQICDKRKKRIEEIARIAEIKREEAFNCTAMAVVGESKMDN